MTPEFREAFPCLGVDTERTNPAMIVPLGGTSMVVVLGGGKVQVASQSDNIELREVDLNARNLNPYVVRLTKVPDAAKLTVNPLPHDARFFSVKGNSQRGGADGVKVTARLGDKTAILRVVVLGERKVEIAMREIFASTPDGKGIRHSNIKHDVPALIETMNFIWQPQANITFKAVEIKPLILQGPLPAEVNLQEYKAKLGEEKGGSKYGLFFVAKAISKDPKSNAKASVPNGVTDHDFKVALISDSANFSTLAHEAGHLLGQVGHPPPKITHLMQDGGPGSGTGKIPFDKVVGIYNNNYVKPKN